MPYLDPKAIIPEAKLTQYLLIRLPKDDKSQFLAKAGYNLSNWQELARDIRQQILPLTATPTISTKFGQKYEIYGTLTGANGVTLKIITVWIVSSTETRFVTLVPQKLANDY
jgi:hypothetical protein